MLLKFCMKSGFLSQNITKIDAPPLLIVQHSSILHTQGDDSVEAYGSQLQDGSQ